MYLFYRPMLAPEPRADVPGAAALWGRAAQQVSRSLRSLVLLRFEGVFSSEIYTPNRWIHFAADPEGFASLFPPSSPPLSVIPIVFFCHPFLSICCTHWRSRLHLGDLHEACKARGAVCPLSRGERKDANSWSEPADVHINNPSAASEAHFKS